MSTSSETITYTRVRFWTEALSILLFIVSLTFPAFCTNGGGDPCVKSLTCLLLGWGGLFHAGASIAWLANPMLILAWILTPKNRSMALAFSATALVLMLAFLLFDEVKTKESGTYSVIIRYHYGYWFWLSSSSALTLGLVILQFLSNQPEVEDEEL
ncbi:MAG: hypothetical protein ACFB10_18795 [Salibacteraceae bacterium]